MGTLADEARQAAEQAVQRAGESSSQAIGLALVALLDYIRALDAQLQAAGTPPGGQQLAADVTADLAAEGV